MRGQTACAELRGALPRPGRLLLGADDDVAVWVDGQRVAALTGSRAPEPGQLEVALEGAGMADVQLVVCQRRGLWGVYLDTK